VVTRCHVAITPAPFDFDGQSNRAAYLGSSEWLAVIRPEPMERNLLVRSTEM